MTFEIAKDGTVTTTLEKNSDTGAYELEDKALDLKIAKVDEDGNVVTGAELKLVDADGKVVDRWTSTTEAYDVSSKVEAGKTYTLTETKAPAGYAYAADVTFEIAKDGTVTTTLEKNFDTGAYELEDKALKLKIAKVNKDGNPVAGAKLEIQDASGAVVDSWISGDEAYDVDMSKVKAGESYTLVETDTPVGYAYAEGVTITIEKDGTVTTNLSEYDELGAYGLVDEELEFKVDKVDSTDITREVDGAELTVYGKDDSGEYTVVVDSWTSAAGQIHDFGDKLKAGETYLLRETRVANGYRPVADILFTVERDGSITLDSADVEKDENGIYLVKDEPVVVHIRKVREQDHALLAGAQLQIVDSKGKEVANWISEGEPYTLIGKLSVGETYTLIELNPPTGYCKAWPIEFTISEDGKEMTITMVDEIYVEETTEEESSEEETETFSESPETCEGENPVVNEISDSTGGLLGAMRGILGVRTGDDSTVFAAFYVMVMAASVAIIVLIVKKRKRSRKSHKK